MRALRDHHIHSHTPVEEGQCCPGFVPAFLCLCSKTKVGVSEFGAEEEMVGELLLLENSRKPFSSINNEILYHPINLNFCLIQKIWRYAHFVKLFIQKGTSFENAHIDNSI